MITGAFFPFVMWATTAEPNEDHINQTVFAASDSDTLAWALMMITQRLA